MESSGWVAVRCILRSQGEDSGEAVYEERVTLWRDVDMDQAIEKAEAEARTHASETTWLPDRVTEYLGLAQAYALFDEPGDGAEVFSLMRTSDLAPAAYLDRFFDTGRERQGDAGESAELARDRLRPCRDVTDGGMTGCSPGASSPAVRTATNHGGAVPEHAMSAHYALQGGGFGSALERESIRSIERALSSALEASGTGELDGDEFGGGEAVLYAYGIDADGMFSTAEVILRSCALRPAYVVLRYGEADDPTAREVRIDL